MIKLTKITLFFICSIACMQASNEYYGDDELSKNSDCSSTYHDDFNDDDPTPFDLSVLNQAATTVDANMMLQKYNQIPWEAAITSARKDAKKAKKEVKAIFGTSMPVVPRGSNNSTPAHIAAQTPHAETILRYILILNPEQAVMNDNRGLTPEFYTKNKAKLTYLNCARTQNCHDNDYAFIADDDSWIKNLVSSLKNPARQASVQNESASEYAIEKFKKNKKSKKN